MWTTQTAQLVLGYPMARGFPTSGAIYSLKDRLGDEVCRSPQKWQEAIGQGGEGTAGFQSFGPMDLSTHKQGCLMWQARAEPSKLCVPGQGPSCLGLRVILMCPGVYSNLLIMQNAQNVLFEPALEAGTDVPPPKMCNHACVILLFRVD